MSADLPRTADAVVVGGGVMGASTAYHLARRGVRDVVLLEREQFLGQMSTGQCAGGIRHQFSTEINIRLSIESIRMMERFPEELDQDVGLKFCGYLFLLTQEDELPTFRENVALQHRLGIETEWMEPPELAERVPLLNLDGVLGGTSYERDGLADPSSVVQGYTKGARREGGAIETPVVVNACGAWAPQMGRMVGVEIPIQPIRRQVVVTASIPQLPEDFPFVIYFADSLYFHPEGEGILTGQSNNDETPGYKLDVDTDWEARHMEAAVRRFPLLADAGFLTHWAGLYEVTPDAHPILGAVPDVAGFYVMAGFSGHGFMHGPVAGLLMAEEIVDGKAHTVDVDAFRIDRFASGDLHPEYNVI